MTWSDSGISWRYFELECTNLGGNCYTTLFYVKIKFPKDQRKNEGKPLFQDKWKELFVKLIELLCWFERKWHIGPWGVAPFKSEDLLD